MNRTSSILYLYIYIPRLCPYSPSLFKPSGTDALPKRSYASTLAIPSKAKEEKRGRMLWFICEWKSVLPQRIHVVEVEGLEIEIWRRRGNSRPFSVWSEDGEEEGKGKVWEAAGQKGVSVLVWAAFSTAVKRLSLSFPLLFRRILHFYNDLTQIWNFPFPWTDIQSLCLYIDFCCLYFHIQTILLLLQ